MYRVYKVMEFKISITLYCSDSSYLLVKLLKFIFMTTVTLESKNEKKRKNICHGSGCCLKYFL